MTKRTAMWTVIGYFTVFFGAVFLRIDFFPLTWVPMYGERDTGPVLHVKVGGLDRRGKGFRATQADGQVVYINARDLNMPPANFRRLYNERMFGEGPPQHRRERLELAAFNRWWYDTLLGPLQVGDGMYQQQLLESVNRTLRRAPDATDRIVKLEAEIGEIRLTREQRRAGKLSALHITDLLATVTPEGSQVTEVASSAEAEE